MVLKHQFRKKADISQDASAFPDLQLLSMNSFILVIPLQDSNKLFDMVSC